ncbi:IS66 family transposase [Pseudoalteromonas nigrifaciens]|uniref:IS66 family transposase n=1 Tax=Pseudoalteromonas nigrifaciens TaxID=28109 RepID=UPI003FD0E330
MNLNSINITEIVEQTKTQLQEDKTLSPALKMSIELILVVVVMLASKLGLNSQNSSIPPSKDINRTKPTREKSEKSAGGQKSRVGKTLTQTEIPDEVQVILVDRDFLPKGHYREVGFQKRQVVDIDISKVVTEYQAQILENEQGKRFVGEFPQGVNGPIQYGVGVKAHAVYLSQYQLLPYNRIEEYFSDQLGIPISAGSLFNFNEQAAALVKSSGAEGIIKAALQSPHQTLHVDETGINIGGKRRWLHGASTTWWTYFYPHEKRGKIAMDEAGILPHFTGVLCHDHWKPYYQYTQCQHALCNAHHIRELERAWEQDGMQWAKDMQTLLKEMNKAQIDNPDLDKGAKQKYREQYQKILLQGDAKCPPPDKSSRVEGQRGRLKRTKSRALLERLRDYQDDVLRFMMSTGVPFTNNQGENDIRMTKVHQKISGCFRSKQGAEMFCLLRSYLSTCRKQYVSASLALELLFKNQLPDIFISDEDE